MATPAMAAAAFCSISQGYGVAKLNKKLLSRHSMNRIYSKRLCIEMYFNSTTGTQIRRPIRNHRGISLKCRAQHNDTLFEEGKEESISKATLIWRAIKLPMYTVAFIPITVGGAAAYLQTGQYFVKRYLLLLVSSSFIIAWLNLSNDVYDSDTGADKNKKESVVNLFGSRTGTHIFAWLLLALGFVGLAFVSMEARSVHSLCLLACAIICGYMYQCPPFRLSYLGLGEPLCFAAFGPFATTAFYLLQSGTRPVSNIVVSSSILVGITTSMILFCSHFHQVDDDKAVGKYSPLVRLGTEGGAKVMRVAAWVLYSLVIILGLGEKLPFSSTVLCALTIPIANFIVRFVEANHKDKTKIFMAKYYCVRLHTAFGVALAAGLVAARMFARRQLPHAIVL